VYNIGTGVGRSNRDILEALQPLARAERLEIRTKTLPPRKFDVPLNVLDSSELRRIAGWETQISFNEGIRRTWKWFRSNYIY
jgi:UDP-glucose 4-epimerase